MVFQINIFLMGSSCLINGLRYDKKVINSCVICAIRKIYCATPEYKERHRKEMLEWRRAHPRKALIISRRNYKRHKDKFNSERRLKLKTDPAYKKKIHEREKRYKASGRRGEMHRKRYKKNRIVLLIVSQLWKLANADAIKEYQRKYARRYWRKHEQELRDKLDDSYVIMVIKKDFYYKIKTQDIPKELIEIKRLQIFTHRKLKQIT
jgi:hypothetical protein